MMKKKKTTSKTKKKPTKLGPRFIRVNCCMDCPLRKPFDEVVDGTVDVCGKNNYLVFPYAMYSTRHTFPGKCPLPKKIA